MSNDLTKINQVQNIFSSNLKYQNFSISHLNYKKKQIEDNYNMFFHSATVRGLFTINVHFWLKNIGPY